MPNPKPNMQGLKSGLHPNVAKALNIKPLGKGQVSGVFRARLQGVDFERLKRGKAEHVGALLEWALKNAPVDLRQPFEVK
jgi:hypothetical protein